MTDDQPKDSNPQEPGEQQPASEYSVAQGDTDTPPEAELEPVSPPSVGDELAEVEQTEDEVVPDDGEEPVRHELAVDGESESQPVGEEEATAEPTASTTSAAQSDDTSDVASIPDEAATPGGTDAEESYCGDWQVEMSAHRIAVELKRVETRVRELLADRDPRRKRKLAGTYRWHELNEDIIVWRAERRIDAQTLEELHRLVCRRHFLFDQLRFAAATRPTWNT